MPNSLVIAIIFKLVNFAVIVSLFIFLCKRYVMPWIYAALEEKKKVVDDLEHMINVLHAEHESLNRNIQAQETLHKELTLKLERWNSSFEKLKKQYEQQKEKRRLELVRINDLRAHAIMVQKIERIVVPEVVSKLTEQLKAHYSNQHKGEAFVDYIVTHISKDVA